MMRTDEVKHSKRQEQCLLIDDKVIQIEDK